MASPNTVAYCYMGPGVLADHIDEIQQSGLTTVVLWALHVGRPSVSGQQYGDLVYDYTGMTLVSAGAFNPFQKDDIAAWPSQVAALKQSGSVSKIFMSIGGANPPIDDFTTIQKMLKNGQGGVLQENFQALRTAFTVNGSCAIDGFDMDCEESIDESTMVQFCQMLFKLGFEVTFCPYWNQQFWQSCMQTLWNQGLKVSWWNLQCYAGGGGNGSQVPSWIASLGAVVGDADAASYLVPGLAVQGSEGDGQCPTGTGGMWESFAGWRKLGLGGGFLWTYDDMLKNTARCPGPVNLAAYVAAINTGLGWTGVKT
jgi:hypothetical protein